MRFLKNLNKKGLALGDVLTSWIFWLFMAVIILSIIAILTGKMSDITTKFFGKIG